MNRFVRIIVCILILGVGAGIAAIFIVTKPKVKKKDRAQRAEPVEVIELRSVYEPICIEAMGVVLPATRVVLKPEISGKVVWENNLLTPGSVFSKGDTLLRIDESDYKFTLNQRKADLQRRIYELRVEEGRQIIAKKDWARFGDSSRSGKVDVDLVLRKPHLKNAKAAVDAAESGVKKAELDLSRTAIKAPFDSVVIDESVAPGMLASPQTQLMELASSSAVWVRVSVAVKDLPLITLPTKNKKGASVKIICSAGNGSPIVYEGYVLRLYADLESTSRMARLLVHVSNPRKEGAIPLLLGSYVKARISGKSLPDVLNVPRVALRNDSQVWSVTKDNKLKMNQVKVVYRGKDFVLIRSELAAGDKVITTRLAAAVDNMAVQILNAEISGESK